MEDYAIWTLEKMKELRANSKADKQITEAIMQIIEIANERHNTEMLKKDVTIAGLRGHIEGIKGGRS